MGEKGKSVMKEKTRSKLANLIAEGAVDPEDLVQAEELIERAKLVKAAMEKIPQKVVFLLGTKKNQCYNYTDSAGEYSAWGECDINGTFTVQSNWGGTHINGTCNLTDFSSIFKAFDEWDNPADLRRFLESMVKEESV